MYESFFGFSRRPFTAPPDADCYVPVSTTQEAVAELLLCVRQGDGIAVLTAPAGLGKSLVCRHLAGLLREECEPVVLPRSGFDSSSALLQAVLYELGHAWTGMALQELRLELRTALAEAAGDDCPVVLIFDEAHLLEPPLLEEIRCLADLQQGGKPLVRIVLCGQLELEESLALPENSAFNQRIRCQTTLPPLSRLESAEYLLGRLQQVGSELGDVFTREAVQLICRAADGNPRCLNQLCDQSLLMASIAEESPVTEQTVRDALDDVQQLPLHWNIPAGRDFDEAPQDEPPHEIPSDDTASGELTAEEFTADETSFADLPPAGMPDNLFDNGTGDTPPLAESADAPAAFETAEPATAAYEPPPVEQPAVLEVGESADAEPADGAPAVTEALEEEPAQPAATGSGEAATVAYEPPATATAGEWPSLEVGAEPEVGADEPSADAIATEEATGDDSHAPAPAGSGVLDISGQDDATTGHDAEYEALDLSELDAIAETESPGDSMFHREPVDSFAPPAPVAAFECGAEEVTDERHTTSLSGGDFSMPPRADASEPLHEAETAELDAAEVAMMEELLAESCMAADAGQPEDNVTFNSLPDDATTMSESAGIGTDPPDTTADNFPEEDEGGNWEAPCIEFGIDDTDEADDWATGSWTSLENAAEADELAEFLTFDQPAITTDSTPTDAVAETGGIDPELEWERQLELAAESEAAPGNLPVDAGGMTDTGGNSITPQVPPVLWSISGDDGFGGDDDSWQPAEWLPPDLVVPQGDGWVPADTGHQAAHTTQAETPSAPDAPTDSADSPWQPVSLEVTRDNTTTAGHIHEPAAAARPVPGELGPSREVEATHPESGEAILCREQEVLDRYARLAARAASEQVTDAGERAPDPAAHPPAEAEPAPRAIEPEHVEPEQLDQAREPESEQPARPAAEPVHRNPLAALDNVSQLIDAALRPAADDSVEEYFHPETIERLIDDDGRPHEELPQVADHTGDTTSPTADSATRDLDSLSRLAGDNEEDTPAPGETPSPAEPTYRLESAGESLEEQIGRSILDTSIDAQRVVEQRLDQAITEERQAGRPQIDDWQPVDPTQGTEAGGPAPGDRVPAGPQVPPIAADQGTPSLPVDPTPAATGTDGGSSVRAVHGAEAASQPEETLLSSGRRRFARLFTDLRLRQSGRSQRTGGK